MLRKTIWGLILLGGASISATAQTKILLTSQMKQVPKGKKWILETGKEMDVEISNGTLRSGTPCNSMITSNPGMTGNIIVGEYGIPEEIYGLIIKDISKPLQTNDNTYSILPVTITDSKFSASDLQYSRPENVGSRKIIFYSGQKIHLSDCLISIPVIEVDVNSNYGETATPSIIKGKLPKYVYTGSYRKRDSLNTRLDVSLLLSMKSPDQLKRNFGRNITVENYKGPDGDLRTGLEYILYPKTQNEVRINFDQNYIRFTTKKSEWKLTNGLYIGCTLDEAEKKNGIGFFLYGFEWDEGGSVESWNKGNLANSNILLIKFSPTVDLDYDEYTEVIGRRSFSSSNSIMRKLKPEISEIIISKN